MAQHRIFGIPLSAKRTNTELPEGFGLRTETLKTGFNLGTRIFGAIGGMFSTPVEFKPVSADMIVKALLFDNADLRNAFSLKFEDHVVLGDPLYIRMVEDVIAGYEYANTVHNEKAVAVRSLRVAANALSQFGATEIEVSFYDDFIKALPTDKFAIIAHKTGFPQELEVGILKDIKLIRLDPSATDAQCNTPGYFVETDTLKFCVGSSMANHETELAIMRGLVSGLVDELEEVMFEQYTRAVKTKIVKEIRHRAEGSLDLPFPNFYLQS